MDAATRPVATKTVRAGSTQKRAAILAAARELFLRDGFERTSMDAVAALAAVSKRTVYDYYGDKSRLLTGVVEDAAEQLSDSLHGAIVEHLADDGRIGTVADLEAALVAFAIEIGTTVLASANYATVFTLIAEQRAELSEIESRLMTSTEPEDDIAERFAHFDALGLLDAPDPKLAADHFNALTVLLAYNNHPGAARADLAEVSRIMTDGVGAFMRAYMRR